MVGALQLKVENVIQRIDRITPSIKIVSSIQRVKNCLPLKSIEDIKDIEIRLQQEDFVKEYVSKKLRKKFFYVIFLHVIFLY